MTDRRRNTFPYRVWRATFGHVKPLLRLLDGRGFWAWWTATGVIPRWQLLLVYVLVIVAGMVGMASTRSVADRANGAALDAKHAVAQVQASRIELCEQANERHDAVIAELERQIARLSPKRRAEANARKAGTIALLEAIAPRRDCVEALRPTP
jgi:hypothetical protein